MASKVNIDDTEGLQEATQRVQATLAALKEAGAPQALVEALVGATQARAAHLILARRAHRDGEFYPYFPESYGPEADAYDGVAQLVATSMLGAPGCGECGHPEGSTPTRRPDMAQVQHPLAVGARVYNSRGQQWAHSVPGGTAVVLEVLGPDHRGDYEYVVDGCREFSRQPGPDNPMNRRTQWASYNTAPAKVTEE
jgi:hypothetical protein